MRLSPTLVARLIACLFFIQSAFAADGTIANLSYPNNELFKAISPQLSTQHYNQPVFFNGYGIFAGNGIHDVWDLSNPYNPELKASMTSIHRNGEAETHQATFARYGDTFYMVTISGKGIDIWDVTDTLNPIYVTALELAGINYGDVSGGIWGICWQGNHIYVGATTNGLYVVDAEDPAAPTHVATYSQNDLGGVAAGPLFALGNLLVVTTPKDYAGVATVDITNPENPVLMDAENFPDKNSYIGGFYGTFASLLYGLRFFEVYENPYNIRLIKKHSRPKSEYVSYANDYLFLGGLRGGTEGIYKYDISNTSNIVEVGRFIGRDPRWDDQFSVPIGNIMLVCDDQLVDNQYVGGLVVVHDTNPDNSGPTVKAVMPKSGSTNQSIHSKVGLSLSEWPEFASVDDSTFIVRPVGGNALPGKYTCTYTTLTFEPDTSFAPDTTYEIVLPVGGITDGVGNGIDNTYISTFTTNGGAPTYTGNSEITGITSGEVGDVFEMSVVDPDPNMSYLWQTVDGAIYAGTSMSHIYQDEGRHLLMLQTIDPSLNPPVRFEAEDGILSGGVNIRNNTPVYVSYADGQGPDVKTEWTVNSVEAGLVDLAVNYANGTSSDRKLTLKINDQAHSVLNFGGHGTLRFEAETADLQGGVAVASNNPGWSGTGVADFPGDQGSAVKVVWNVNRSSPVEADLVFGYANIGGGDRPLSLYVNGSSITTLSMPSTGAWTNYSTITANNIQLLTGNNVIELRADAGSQGPNVDYMDIVTNGWLDFKQVVVQDAILNAGDNKIELVADAGTAGPNIDFMDVTISTLNDVVASTSIINVVHYPVSSVAPVSSQPILIDDELNRVWVVNTDTNTISAVHRFSYNKDIEVVAGTKPTSIAMDSNRDLWVVNQESANITIHSSSSGAILTTIDLAIGSQPFGIIIDPSGSSAYVTLQDLGQLVKIDVSSRNVVGTLQFDQGLSYVPPQIRGLAMSGDGNTLFVTRFVSSNAGGEVYEVNPGSMTLVQTIGLANNPGPDTSLISRGIPNYLVSATISPDGRELWLPSKQDNIERGGFRDGQTLNNENTTRSIISRVSMTTKVEDVSDRFDLDNQDRPQELVFSRFGDLVFAAMPSNDHITVIDAYTGSKVTQIPVGKAPEGVYQYQNQLYVLNFMSRSLSLFDVSDILTGGVDAVFQAEVNLVDNELLTPEVLLGKQLFYNASSKSLNKDGYMACSSCHLDGNQDGMVWDITDFGEGIRNTIDLRGRGEGHGRRHWSANFDEVQDFENQLRSLSEGEGLMDNADFLATQDPLGAPKAGHSADLDALAAYVDSLTDMGVSPYRNQDESLSADALAGKQIFENLNCASCHSGKEFTDSALGFMHDVGTLTAASGQRLGSPFTGIDTPTLGGLWRSAPYLHDGSAATLEAVFASGTHGADTASLNTSEKDQLIQYLLQIDSIEMGTSPLILVDRTDEAGGIIISEHNDSPAAEGDDKAFDNNGSTKYLTFNNSGWMQYQFGSGNKYTVVKYSITSGNDAPERDPLNWTLSGSNDGSNWVTLDSRSGVDFVGRGIKSQFSVSNNTAYEYYRFDAVNNSGSIMQYAEIELFSPSNEDGSGSSGGNQAPIWTDYTPAIVNVSVVPGNFTPDPTIIVGDTVHWTWDGGGNHNTKSVAGIAESWESPIQGNGSTFDHTFTHAGRFEYYCSPHGSDNGDGTASGMSGVITVIAPASTNTIVLSDLNVGDAISGSLAGNAFDADGDSLTFSRDFGPTWLTVNADGSLSGIPTNANGGLNQFNISVSDGNSISVPLLLQITVNGAADPYITWKTNYNVVEDLGDKDGDGVLNIMEFALGGNPNEVDSANRIPEVVENGSNFEFSFRRSEESVTYIVQKSPDLISWTDYTTVTDIHGVVGSIATVQVPDSEMDGVKLFLRLKVEN